MFNLINERFQSGYNCLFLNGNVNDYFLQDTICLPLRQALVNYLSNEHWSIFNTQEPSNNTPIGREAASVSSQNVLSPAQIMNDLEKSINNAVQEQVIIIQNVEHIFYPQEQIEALIRFRDLIKLAADKQIYLVIISQIEPSKFLRELPDTTTITLTQPDTLTRNNFFSSLYTNEIAANVARLTAGFSLKQCRHLASAAAHYESPNFSELVKAQTIGSASGKSSPWDLVSKDVINRLEVNLKTQIKGQDCVIKQMIKGLKRATKGVNCQDSTPRMVSFFCGTTGVGKTQVAKIIANSLFGDDAFLRLDMSEFQESHKVSTLLGAPSGYSNCEAGGVLTNFVRDNPYSIILFDEIEKAHPDIYKTFLQLLSEGRLTSSLGESVYFHECIVIFTSNLGFNQVSNEQDYQLVISNISSSVERFFKAETPELYGRLDGSIVVFDLLRSQYIVEIVSQKLDLIASKWMQHDNIEVHFSKSIHGYITNIVNVEYGARNVETQTNLLNEYVAEYVFDHEPKGVLVVDYQNERVVIST